MRKITAPDLFPSKLYSQFSIEADPVSASLHARRDEPCFIICPGPTSLEINPDFVIGRGVTFRMNTFFFESDPHFGKKIDGYFGCIDQDVFYDELQNAIEVKGYQIDAFFTPFIFRREDQDLEKIALYNQLFTPASDHYAIIALNPVLGREMMGRPLPSEGFRTLAAAAVLGFKEIHLIGADLYVDKTRRYSYEYPERVKGKVDKRHYLPGYQQGAHARNRDLIFLEAILTQFPKTLIYNASRVSPLMHFLPQSPLVEGKMV
ncbi:alpha-2,3-sialyltransferase [Hyphococcus flavus]|uniref:Alpha-2,3-sialyltransferase n=1 Tax=Hyphococcus flavus TaxID=1866326 RepID=A0AAE9ZAB3_9PROT|nr:alpha-2,3-sialyltransferase [Hyphococcus flavus]WDI30548.1 alpha-2,3-sialyltransferase [Hyphococcus flavus]